MRKQHFFRNSIKARIVNTPQNWSAMPSVWKCDEFYCLKKKFQIARFFHIKPSQQKQNK